MFIWGFKLSSFLHLKRKKDMNKESIPKSDAEMKIISQKALLLAYDNVI